MTIQNEKSSHSRWIGLLLIIIGSLFFLDSMNIFNIGGVLAHWWPLILIIIGFTKLKGDNKTGGAILFIVGIVFLSATLDIINWGSILRFWPVILIAIGISLFLKSRGKSWTGRVKSELISEDFIRASAFFGGVDRSVNSSNFRGGDIIALFGGIELDLRRVQLSPDGCNLNLTALFGGVEVFVPTDWQVSISGTPILGAIENKTTWTGEEKEGKKITCLCTVAFGGIEVRN